MLTINQAIYEKLSSRLIDEISHKRYYSGDITLNEPDVDYKFSSTLMIYFSEQVYPEGISEEITNIVPIWWECHTTTDEGERLNDFDFGLLKELICN